MSRDAARAARLFVTETLLGWGDGDLAEDAAIITAELAANAVVHARTAFTIDVCRAAASVRISVRDEDPVLSLQGDSLITASPGHGLGLVEVLSSRWGADLLPTGKTIWAELRRE
jgi:hypothetical protein